MIAKVTGWKKRWSHKNNRDYFHVFLKGDDTVNYMVYIDPINRNYANWVPLLKKEQWIKGLIVLNGGNLIDADSPIESTQDPGQPELF